MLNMNKKMSVPGHGCLETVKEFYDMHYQTGELFFEFLKGTCMDKTSELCKWCEENHLLSEHMTHVLRPYLVPGSTEC